MAKAKAKAEKKEQPEDEFELLARNLPPDAKKRLLDIKAKLDSFKVKLLEKFDKYVIGISLLPPSRKQESDFSQLRIPTTLGMPAPEKPILPKLPKGDKIAVAAPEVQQAAKSPEADKQAFDQETINCLILVDDSDSKKMSKLELRDKLSRIMESMATEVDKNLKPQTLLLSELWQNCYDGKYEILNLIAMSAITFDMGMLKAIKIAEVHKGMVLKKFERYIVSYVLAGSLVQGRATEKSDIDVFIVIDDTDVKRMTRFELKDKLRAIIISMGIEAGELTGIKNKLNIQIYILTDFWDSIKEANPVIFTFLRDGVPFYDRGMFMPWKQLLKIGKIKPSQEAIDLYMSTGDQMLNRVKFKIKEIGMEDTYWSILTPSQAALMLYGVSPPTPKETAQLMRDIFVKKEKLLEDEYVRILENNIEVRKKLEHGELKEFTGRQADELLMDAEKYLKRIDKLFKDIEEVKEREAVLETYEEVIKTVREVLKGEGIKKAADSQLLKLFEDELIAEGKAPAKMLRAIEAIMKAKQDYDSGNLTKAEVAKTRKESQILLRNLLEYLQRKLGRQLDKARIRVRHGDKIGEVLLLEDKAIIIHDITQRDKSISLASVTSAGSLTNPKEININDYDKLISEFVAPEKVLVNEKTFSSLKNIFGKDVEIIMS